MKTNEQIEREIKLATDFVNSFPKFDPTNQAQTLGFAVLDALEWARGKRVDRPSLRWPGLTEMARLTKIITDSGMSAQAFSDALSGPEGDAIADAKRGKR